MEDNQKRVLSSWKEVASYLDVSVRTAQMWEADRGLPVNRLPGGRGVVWADKAELDNWRKSGANHTVPRDNGPLAESPNKENAGGVPGNGNASEAPLVGAGQPVEAGKVRSQDSEAAVFRP